MLSHTASSQCTALKKMLESRPEDALVKLVLNVLTLLTVLTVLTVLAVLTVVTALIALTVVTVLTVYIATENISPNCTGDNISRKIR